MSQNFEFRDFQAPEFFSRRTLELTFRLLRYRNPALSKAIERALDEVAFAPREALYAVTEEVHLNKDLIKSLCATDIIKVVAALNDTARNALEQKDLPATHMKLLGSLIEDWAALAEWILQHTTSDRTAFLRS
jgi:hypothetical protein